MAEIDDATVAARTKEILETDEAIKTQYGDGSLTVKTLRKAVAAALGAEESAIKKVVKSTLLAYMDEQEPQEEEESAADEEEEAPEAPKKEKKKKAKRTDRLTDKAALDAKLKEDNWQITEKPRPTKEGGAKPSRHVDKYYKKPGESKQYRSLLEIARAHYPEFLTGEPPAKKEKPQKEKNERAPRSASAKPKKKLELGKITKAGKGAASKAPPKRKERPPTPPPAKKPKPPPPEQVVNSAWASVPERVIAADKVLPKLVQEKNWDEIKKMLKMLGRDLGVPYGAFIRCDSWPSHFHESGFCSDFEAIRTASSDRDAPRRRMDVDVDALTSCGIGRTVNKLKKAESEDVQTLAKALVKKWKDLVAAQEPADAPATEAPAAAPAPAAEEAAAAVTAEVTEAAAADVAAETAASEAAAAVAAEATAEVAAEVAAAEAPAAAPAENGASAAPADDAAGSAPMDVDAGAAAPAPAPADAAAP